MTAFLPSLIIMLSGALGIYLHLGRGIIRPQLYWTLGCVTGVLSMGVAMLVK